MRDLHRLGWGIDDTFLSFSKLVFIFHLLGFSSLHRCEYVMASISGLVEVDYGVFSASERFYFVQTLNDCGSFLWHFYRIGSTKRDCCSS
jgi:hypothetical protein